MKPIRFLLYNLALLLLLSVLYYFVAQSGGVPYNPVIPSMFAGFAILNQFFFRMLLRAHARSPQRFVTSFIGVVGIKLMSAMVFLLLYLMLVDENDVIYIAASLFIAYMSFTILLIRAALSAGAKA